MRIGRKGFLALAVSAALVALPACSKSANENQGGTGDKKIEVFSWWTGPGEEDGLKALIEVYKKDNPGVEFTNAAVSGGAGSNAKAILADRLRSGNPPDSYQRHAGKELLGDIKANKVEDLTSLYEKQKWNDVFPKGLIDAIKVDGKIYSVPVNIHRSNLLWYNPKVLTDAGIQAPPKDWKEFLSQAATLRAKGKIPLSIAAPWTQKHLLENVLLGELKTDKYNGLWDGKTDWTSAEVVAALDTFKKVLEVSDISSPAADWQPALDKVIDGAAAYNVMGDWAAAYLEGTKKLKIKEGYGVANSPGTDGVFNFLSDSFTLPKGAKNKGAAEKWLIACGSKAGQDAFNPKKGSIPARNDVDKALYKGYLETPLADWANKDTKVVGSLAHGVVANDAWNTEIDTALALFVKDRDVNKLAGAIKKSYESSGK